MDTKPRSLTEAYDGDLPSAAFIAVNDSMNARFVTTLERAMEYLRRHKFGFPTSFDVPNHVSLVTNAASKT